jgi:hypothetical protein
MPQKPDAPKSWNGQMILVYPNGEQSDMDLNGSVARPGEPFPGKPGYILQHFDVADRPMPDGRYMVVGVLRHAKSEER